MTDDPAALLRQPFLDDLPVRVAADADAEIRAAGGDLQRRRPQQLLRAGPTALPYNLAVYSFIETRLFSKLLFDYLGGNR